MLHEHESLEVGRWTGLMSRLGLGDSLETFDELQKAYAEKHRHYHTCKHINDCLLKLDQVRHLAQQPDEVELALWFHDAVYATRSKQNEAKSAAWATKFLAGKGVDPRRVERVHDLIMVTRHDAPVDDPDGALMADIDLSILGADAETFERFEQDVREEYWWVPAKLFSRTRASILQSFLDRPSVYGTAYFRQEAELQARRNLTTAIATLSKPA